MSNPSPESYGWVADDEYTWFAVAGCVTVVAGSGPEGALTAIGADLEQSARLEDVVDADGLSWVSASRLESPAPGEASVLLEDNGREGSRPEVLIRLSKAGKAAAVYWNVKGLVIFACARRGKVLAQIEMPEVDDVDGVPRNLLRLLREADRHPDTVAVAMAMAEKFTGIPVPPTPAVRRPATAHPITEPVLGLRVTTDELLVLGYPTPELVAAVQTATPHVGDLRSGRQHMRSRRPSSPMSEESSPCSTSSGRDGRHAKAPRPPPCAGWRSEGQPQRTQHSLSTATATPRGGT